MYVISAPAQPHRLHTLYAPLPCTAVTGVKVARKDATWPTFQSLALPGRPGISLVGSCCRQVSWPSSRDVLSTNVLVVQSDLQAAFIEQQGQLLAWVTTTQGQSKPVANAKVQIYSSVYGVVSVTRARMSSVLGRV